MKNSKVYYQGIGGLRGVAATLVFIFHLREMAEKYQFFPWSDKYTSAIFSIGKYGVEIFFVISGFLISKTLIDHGNLKKFFIDRIFRIYPLFLFLHIIIFAIGPIVNYKIFNNINLQNWTMYFFCNLFMLPGVFKLPLAQLNAWSLSYEILFYLISALIFKIFKSNLKSNNLKIAISALVIFPLIVLLKPAIFFAVGFACYRWNIFKRCELIPSPALTGIAFLIFISSLLAGEEMKSNLIYYISILPMYIYFCGMTINQGSFAFERGRVAVWLGTISYSFYLCHPFVTYLMRIIVLKVVVFSSGVKFAIFSIASIIISIVFSKIANNLFEIKIPKYLKAKIAL